MVKEDYDLRLIQAAGHNIKMRLLVILQVLSYIITAFAAPIHVQTIENTLVALPPKPATKLRAPNAAIRLCKIICKFKSDERRTYAACFRDRVSRTNSGATDAADQLVCCLILVAPEFG
ncbi:uncharacterized protein Bfra_004356 [Botrytis fragariae]|uniref:Uncharacterized protein n=1 Tax=Botrytis fragariae TaxID=1964551 RepID=A0A8H6EJN8_9HELO|nr:uncharacterized protein Bfra_004356 [Botrytis fragariae]KAF5874350.1 hypothetical protein Bfra_004356 [Botrytis fragariae]